MQFHVFTGFNVAFMSRVSEIERNAAVSYATMTQLFRCQNFKKETQAMCFICGLRKADLPDGLLRDNVG